MSVDELVPAIRGSDLRTIDANTGVGRKTAERMVVELKDKLDAVIVERKNQRRSSPAGVEASM